MDSYFQQLLERIATSQDLWAAKELVRLLESHSYLDEPPSVWVIYISHRHGNGVNVFSNEDTALDYLYYWAQEFWGELPVGHLVEIDGQLGETLLVAIPSAPSNNTSEERQRSIDLYFNFKRDAGQNSETYRLDKTDIESTWPPQDPRRGCLIP